MPLYTDRFNTTVHHVPGCPTGTYSAVPTYNITADESGTIFTTSGNLTRCSFYLPAAAAGLEYAFHSFETPQPLPPYPMLYPAHASGLAVYAAAGDQFYFPGFTTAYTSVTVTGWQYSVRFRAFDATGWYYTHNFGSSIRAT